MDDDKDPYLEAARKLGHYGRRTIWMDCVAVGYTEPLKGGTMYINGEAVKLPDISEESLRAEAAVLGVPFP